MPIRRALLRSLIVVACMAAAGSAFGFDKITIVVNGIERQNTLPVALTQQLGYFKEQGLDVELQSDATGVDAETEMLTGAAQGVVGFYDHCVDLQSKGKLVESVVQFGQTPGEVVLVSTRHPEIKSAADLKGREVGVTALGSSTEFLLSYLAAKNGLKRDEYAPVPVGLGKTFISAMQQDRIQAGMATEPTISQMLTSGEARILVDMRTLEGTRAALGGTYPAASLYMPTAWVDAHKDETQRLVNAFVRALHYIASHSAEEIADRMPKDYYAGDKDRYVKALAGGKATFTADGRMPEGGPQTVLAVLGRFSKELQGKTIDLSRTYTSAFVDNVK